ncbi:MAG: nitroreductase family protein [Smithellaceae bacterium]
MATLSEIIKKRISCRSYSDKPLEDKVLQELSLQISATHTGPFGNQPTFKLIHMDNLTPQEWKKLGTYGVIKNARYFLIGTIKNTPMAMEDYGYCKEMLILKATALRLGTCWLGGTFKASEFAKAVDLQEDQILPTVSPIGYPAEEKSRTEKIMRRFAGSDHRKPWSDIFFANDFATPLTREQAEKYSSALENLRLAPSASNKQPWRILLDTAKKVFHFYLTRAASYKFLRLVFLQDIDIGIAMSHFEITAREQGLAGIWLVDTNAPKETSVDYIVSWQSEN